MGNSLRIKHTTLADIVGRLSEHKFKIAQASAMTQSQLCEGDTRESGEMIFINVHRGGLTANDTVIASATESFPYYIRMKFVLHLMKIRSTYDAIVIHIGLDVFDHLRAKGMLKPTGPLIQGCVRMRDMRGVEGLGEKLIR